MKNWVLPPLATSMCSAQSAAIVMCKKRFAIKQERSNTTCDERSTEASFFTNRIGTLQLKKTCEPKVDYRIAS